jgi:LytR cell envelope-related transcriptional attenuator
LKKDKKGQKDIMEEKENYSRASQRQRQEAKKRHRIILILVLVVGMVLAIGALFNIPYINIARRGGAWMGDKISGSTSKKEPAADYLFLNDPQTSKTFSGDVSTLLVLYKGDSLNPSQKIIMYLALFTYNTESGEGKIFLIPETAVAYNTSGQKVLLSQVLKEQGGLDLLRSTVSNISGSDVDYVVTLGFWEAMGAAQGLGIPSIILDEDVVLPNPTNSDVSHLAKGEEIGDSDRLLSYLVAADLEDTWDARLDRAKSYFPEMFYALRAQGQTQLEEGLSSLDTSDLLIPGTGGAEGDNSYIASMIQAFAGLGQGEMAISAVPKVEVVNGCGVPDLGKKVGDKLISLGVVVSGTAGNAKVTVNGEEVNDFSHQVSSIMYRSQELRIEAYARYLGVLMSIGDIKYEPGPGPEVVLVAGKDQAK